MITDPKALADKLRAAAGSMEAAQAATVKQVAEQSKATILANIRSATGGDQLLSGAKRPAPGPRKSGKKRTPREKKIGVSYRVRDGVNGPTALVRATGPLQLVENDVKPHFVVSRFAVANAYSQVITTGKRAGKTRKGRNTREARIASVAFGLGSVGGGRRAVLNLGGGTYRRWTTSHSQGRHPWRRGVEEVTPTVIGIHADNQRKALLAALKA